MLTLNLVSNGLKKQTDTIKTNVTLTTLTPNLCSKKNSQSNATR